MPIHRVPRARLHEDIVSIEREGERIVQVVLDPDDAGRWLVVTQWIGADVDMSVPQIVAACLGAFETRGAS